MSATYDNPSASSKDAVRFLIRDTDTTVALVTDEEIEWLLTQEANVYMAAYAAAQTAVTTAARKGRKKIGNLEISDAGGEGYQTVIARLLQRGQSHQTVEAGGISADDKRALRDDSDWIDPAFSSKQFDTPGLQPAKPSDLEETD